MTAATPSGFPALRDFAYHVAHDLTEPVRAITGFATLLEQHLRQGTIDEQTAEYLDVIRRGGARLTGMILRLVEYSRVLDAELRPGPIDVVTLIGEVLDALGPAKRDSIDEVLLPEGPAAIHADPALLRTCLSQIVENVAMHRDPSRLQCLTITVEHTDTSAVIALADTGSGLSSARQARAFDIFQGFEHVPPAVADRGTGAGLAIAAAAAARHAGTVSLAGNEHGGLTVRVEIPHHVEP